MRRQICQLELARPKRHSKPNQPRAHIAMADARVPDYDLPTDLIFPVALVDPLSVLQEAERGNTPRPSRARLSFVSGVSAIQKKQFENAFKQVRRHLTLGSRSGRSKRDPSFERPLKVHFFRPGWPLWRAIMDEINSNTTDFILFSSLRPYRRQRRTRRTKKHLQ